jgi:hypothetical protein
MDDSGGVFGEELGELTARVQGEDREVFGVGEIGVLGQA